MNSIWQMFDLKNQLRAKLFGLFFMLCGVFFMCMTVWTVATGGEPERYDFLEVSDRAAMGIIFGYIAYQIHSDIRSKNRYRKDAPLYAAVQKNMDAHFDPETTDRNIPRVVMGDPSDFGHENDGQ